MLPLQYASTIMVASRKQRAAPLAQKAQAQPVVHTVPAQTPVAHTAPAQTPAVVPPSPDPARLEFYYKVRDDLKEQIATADTRAIAILTIELAIVAGIATVAPLIVSHYPPLALQRAAARPVPAVLSVLQTVESIVLIVVIIGAILWFTLATLSIWLSMAEVLRAEFTVPTSPKGLLRFIVTSASSSGKGVEAGAALDRYGAHLPFSPYALATEQDLLAAMNALDIPTVVIEDIKVKGAIAREKRFYIQKGMRNFAIQVMVLLFLLSISLVLPAIFSSR